MKGKVEPEIVIDPVKLMAVKNGKLIDMSLTELRMLAFFIANKNRIINRSELFANFWQGKAEMHGNIVDVYIQYIRKKIGKEMIRTIRGQGYCFEAQEVAA